MILCIPDVFYVPEWPETRRLLSLVGLLDVEDSGNSASIDLRAFTLSVPRTSKEPAVLKIMKPDGTLVLPLTGVGPGQCSQGSVCAGVVSANADGSQYSGVCPLVPETSRAQGEHATPAEGEPRPEKSVSSLTLHRRLFHAGKDAVARTPTHTKGVRLSDNPRHLGHPPDEACLHGKLCRHAKDGRYEHDTRINAWDRKVPGGTISIDPHGPYPPSVRLHQYFLLATCDETGYQVGFAYEFPGQLLRLLKEVRRLMGKPDFWRLDRDSKLLQASSSTFSAFEKWCSDEGMGIKSAAPDNQWENGTAEANARRAYEATTAALVDAGLPTKFWCFGIEAYCYVSNRTSVVAKSGKTPFELHWGAAPHIDHLRVFGCPAWSAVSKESRRLTKPQRKKLALTGDVSTPVFTSRAQRAVFVGYPLNQKEGSYLLWRIQTQTTRPSTLTGPRCSRTVRSSPR